MGEEYEDYISDENLKILHEGKDIFIVYQRENDSEKTKGIVRVFPTSKPAHFRFVDVGTWSKNYTGPTNKGFLQIKSEITYDSLGNVISSKAFERQENQDRLHLRESLILQKELVNGKEYYLYNVKGYYETGEIMFDSWLRIIDFNEPKNFWNKKHYKVKQERAFNKDGSLKSEKHYDLEGKLVSKTKF